MDLGARSHGLWAETAPAPPRLAPLKGDAEADVAIVGGGYTGLSAALHLAEKGVSTILLEANRIGFGGAGRNVGLVNAGLWLFPDDVVKLLGPDYGERLITVLGRSPDLVYRLIERHGIDCEAVRSGTLHCAHSPGGLRSLQQREYQWQRRGAPVRLLDRDEAASRIGSQVFYGALFDQRAGTIQPLSYAYGLAGAALREGSRLYEDSPVTGLARDAGRWRLTTPSATVRAAAVIIAVHGYADHIFKDHDAALVPFNYFQFSTAPLSEGVRRAILPGGEGAWDTGLILSSYRLDRAGRLIVGSVGQVENWAYGLHKGWARRTIAKVFPQVGPIAIEHGWYGRIAMTTNHIPRFHILDHDLVMVASYNGRGIGPGTVFGKLLADYVQTGTAEEIPLPVTSMHPIRFRGLRGLFYEAGARLYHAIQRRV
jgi:glycine/D-amino acid oxidase-like deaminating enzyme